MTREKAMKTIESAKHFAYDAIYEEAFDIAIKALEHEPCEDIISRKSIKQKLQEHHDFFVNAYGGFSNLPQNDKSRVDEITNCIAMVVNEPSVTPQEPRKGSWISSNGVPYTYFNSFIVCSECGKHPKEKSDFCPNCGSYNGGASNGNE